jgi:hypothetical protein
VVPAAVRYIVAGSTSLTYSFLGAVAGEIVGGSLGIGYASRRANSFEIDKFRAAAAAGDRLDHDGADHRHFSAKLTRWHAAEQGEAFLGSQRPEDIARSKPGSISLSPDGARVAFAVSSIDGSAYRSALFVAPTDGSAPPNASPRANDSAPRWSPDGTHPFLRLDAWAAASCGAGRRGGSPTIRSASAAR